MLNSIISLPCWPPSLRRDIASNPPLCLFEHLTARFFPALPASRDSSPRYLSEVALVERRILRAALGPNIVEGIGSPQSQGYQMIEFTGRRRAGIVFRRLHAVPGVGGGLV